ncbi:MAG: hypothetical protein QOH71_2696 [Blastocatellia bacterium]|nr:hypothetical protein [Blastocatellia bacterium]
MKRISFGAFVIMAGLGAVIIISQILTSAHSAMAQGQDMQNMPGMKMPKPKAKVTKAAPKKRRVARKKLPSRKHAMSNMPGMRMPAKERRRVSSRKKVSGQRKSQMPGMNMPAEKSPPAVQSARPQSSPRQMPMNMPGMQMPSAPPSPQASPQQQMEMNMPMPSPSPGVSPQTNMPGMQMPTASPKPQSSPEQKMDMNMPMPSASPSASPTGQMPGMDMGGPTIDSGTLLVMSGQSMGVRVGGTSANVMNLGQMGSGTSWQPGSSPMYMIDKIAGKWLLMAHYNFLVGLNAQGGPRGITKFESANWFMPMAFRRVGRGTLQLRGMFSFEPFTFAPGGSPLLFQTGETYKGQPIIDRQHPHDLWMELSAQYTVALGERGTWFTYFGYPGEPALGPPAFMHRASASENPSAALSHHLQDSTHISFGVLTTGFTYRWFKLEGSIFNGREPDENRYNFEAHPWSSRSARLSFEPNKNWSMQVSYGFLRSSEAIDPTTDIHRATASVQYNKPFHRGNWASAFIWGRNHTSNPAGEVHNLNGYTAESTVNFLDKNYFYTRLELVDKDELLRASDRALLGIKDAHPSFRIGAYTFGGVRDVWNSKHVSMAIGSDVTLYSKPAVLDRLYGNTPVSWRLFLRLRPSKMDMAAHNIHGNMKTDGQTMPVKH